jgi:long-subunit fatty acid transport protein
MMRLHRMLRYFACGLVPLALTLTMTTARAAGLWLYEQGTPDVGTATAGMAARADDAATAFANPEGMTRLKESQAMVGIQPIYGDMKFDTDVSTSGGGNGGNAVGRPVGCSMVTSRVTWIAPTSISLPCMQTGNSDSGVAPKTT